jgi:hypothetical protein
VGLCIAHKVAGGMIDRTLALQVLVRRKQPKSRLVAQQRVPERIDAGALGLSTVPTDVIEVGARRLQRLIRSDRPVHPGFNVGHRFGGNGTIGFVGLDRQTGDRVGVSCGHVVGQHGTANAGEAVLAPSRPELRSGQTLLEALCGTIRNVATIGFAFADAATNIDAASFVPRQDSPLDPKIALLGVQPAGVIQDVAIDTPVRKVGAFSELTFGVVRATDLVISLPFPHPAGGERDVWFSGQIGVSSFTTDGDSGSLVLDDANNAVGLHIGAFASMSIATPIQRVLDALDCDLA